MTYLRISAAQADTLRGNYGNWHALDPVPLDGGGYILTDAVIDHPAFADALPTLQSLDEYPPWTGDGVEYAVDAVVEFNGRLKRCIQAHTSQPDWSPDAAPALWVTAHRDGVIPEWRQPQGSHDAYPLDFEVLHNGTVWRSLIADNVWEPGAVGSESLWEQVAS